MDDSQCFLFSRNIGRSPQKLFISLSKNMFSGSKYPKKELFFFGNGRRQYSAQRANKTGALENVCCNKQQETEEKGKKQQKSQGRLTLNLNTRLQLRKTQRTRHSYARRKEQDKSNQPKWRESFAEHCVIYELKCRMLRSALPFSKLNKMFFLDTLIQKRLFLDNESK